MVYHQSWTFRWCRLRAVSLAEIPKKVRNRSLGRNKPLPKKFCRWQRNTGTITRRDSFSRLQNYHTPRGPIWNCKSIVAGMSQTLVYHMGRHSLSLVTGEEEEKIELSANKSSNTSKSKRHHHRDIFSCCVTQRSCRVYMDRFPCLRQTSFETYPLNP